MTDMHEDHCGSMGCDRRDGNEVKSAHGVQNSGFEIRVALIHSHSCTYSIYRTESTGEQERMHDEGRDQPNRATRASDKEDERLRCDCARTPRSY